MPQDKQASTYNQQIWRVRRIDCDGRLPGRVWSSEYFADEQEAVQRLKELIAESDERNPRYPFETQEEDIDGIRGYCNWQFGIMLTLDSAEVQCGIDYGS